MVRALTAALTWLLAMAVWPAAAPGAAGSTSPVWKYEIGTLRYDFRGQLSAGRSLYACQVPTTSSWHAEIATTSAERPAAAGRRAVLFPQGRGKRAPGGYILAKNARVANAYANGLHYAVYSCEMGFPIFGQPSPCPPTPAPRTPMRLDANVEIRGKGAVEIVWRFKHAGTAGVFAPPFGCGPEPVSFPQGGSGRELCRTTTTLNHLRPLKGLIGLPFRCSISISGKEFHDIYTLEGRLNGRITLDRIA